MEEIMEMKTLKQIIFSIFALAVFSCGTPAKLLYQDVAPNIDWSKYTTFGFVEVESEGVTNQELFEKNIALLKEAVSVQMKAKGFQPSSQPDLLINMGVVLKEEKQTRETDFRTDRPRYMGQRNYSWKSEEVVVNTYKTGTLDFHLIDAKKKTMVWQAALQGIVPYKSSKLPKAIQAGVGKLFEGFPVTKTPK